MGERCSPGDTVQTILPSAGAVARRSGELRTGRPVHGSLALAAVFRGWARSIAYRELAGFDVAAAKTPGAGSHGESGARAHAPATRSRQTGAGHGADERLENNQDGTTNMAANEKPSRSSGVKDWLHDVAVHVEAAWDRLRPRDATPDPVIEPYIGYGTPDGCVMRGRVLSEHRFSVQVKARSRLNALRNMARNFFTDEMSGVRVAAGETTTVTDEEGYFQLTVPPQAAGHRQVRLNLPDYGVGADALVVVPSPAATLGVISDIDDTVLETGAYFLPRNLWVSATTFISDRKVFKDTVALLRQLQGDTNPVFYVSSSPWNLHAYLRSIFRAHDVPVGPLFLRDLGISRSKFIKSSHGSHKGDAIDAILAANPQLDFVLIGDSGQHDASVYLAAVERHPGRIRQIVLRTAGEIDIADRQAADAIRRTGVDLFTGPDLTPLLPSVG